MVPAKVFLSQFKLLVWKNWILFRRGPLWLFFEIVIPLGITLMIFFFMDAPKSFGAGKDEDLKINWTTANVLNNKKDECGNTTIGVAFASNIPQVDALFGRLNESYTHADFAMFADKKALMNALSGQELITGKGKDKNKCDRYFGGIYFEVFELGTGKLDFTVFVKNGNIPKLKEQLNSPTYDFKKELTQSQYIKNGYVGMQVMSISFFFEEKKVPRPTNVSSGPFYPNLRMLAIPTHNTGPFLFAGDIYLLLIPMTLRSSSLIVAEQLGGHRELLNIMGMGTSVFFTSHFIFIWIKAVFVIIFALCCIIIRTGEYISSVLLILTGLFYTIDYVIFIGLCAAITPFAEASLMVPLILSSVAIIQSILFGYGPGVLSNMACSLDFNYAFMNTIDIAVDSFQRKKHLGFGEMFANTKTENAFGIHFVMLLVDGVWMYGLMRGIDSLRQNFYLDSLFFWREKKIDMVGDLKLEDLAQNHEKEPGRENTPADIKLNNVVKIYQNGYIAVRKLDLAAHRDQVTCLLGHNGAGKSTAFKMITGITQQTAGEVYVNKEERIGYCPQHNVLYDNMTVWEHLLLFIKMKGVTENINDELGQILADLKLADKANTKAKVLSGGQKRKLCLGMALVGNPRVVLLDEPTAGMDVEARDFVTLFLEKYKRGRSILITTHYLDEAEELGDWIYIMFDGVVFTSGSVDYLIDKYGSGTVLRFLTEDGKNPEALGTNVTQIAQQTVGTKVSSKVFEKTVAVSVANTGLFRDWHANFVRLLAAIETRKQSLGFQSFGIERNSLESVFFRVGELAESLTGKKADELSDDPSADQLRPWMIRPIFRFLALLAKRLIFTANHIIMFLLYMAVPIVGLWLLVDAFQPPGEGVTFNLDMLDGLKFVRSGGVTPLFTNGEIDNYFGNRDLEKFSTSGQYEKFVGNYRDYPRIGLAMHISDSIPYGVYNPSGLHSIPITINTLANLQLKHVAGVTASVTSRIQGYDIEKMNRALGTVSLALGMPMLLLFHMLILTNFVVAEAKCKFDHLQTLTPLTKAHLWFGNFFYDFLWFLALLIAYHIMLSHAGNYTGYFLAIYISSTMYFICIASFVYGISSLFNSSAAAAAIVFIMFVGVSLVAIILFFFYGILKNVMAPSCLISPSFAVSGLLLYIDSISTVAQPHELLVNVWRYDLIGRFILFLFIDMMICFVVFVALRSTLRMWLSSKILVYRGPVEPPLPPNEDILAEENNVQNAPSTVSRDVEQNSQGDYVLKVKKISKGFPGKLALRSITFGIKRGECFGLLGASGAGKTTAFDIITGLTYATSGTVEQEKDRETGVKLGYCPQFDAIIDCMTGYQALVILAVFYGYAHPFKKADQVLALVGMKSMKHKKICNCSGGQKRRISLAGALIANAPLTILDEPTAGVDVKCRHDLWDHLNQIRATKKATMMLTSHSMEECEALCSRIGILNKGEMVAIGSAQYLKSKYGGSFKLTIVLKQHDKRQAALEQVKAAFPSAELLTISDISLHLYWKVDKRDCEQWSLIWQKGSQLAVSLDAKTFCVTQASLEEAFIHVINSGKSHNEPYSYPSPDNNGQKPNPPAH